MRAKNKLQMPPVIAVRDQSTETIDEDPEIEGYSEEAFAFTDITYGIPHHVSKPILPAVNLGFCIVERNSGFIFVCLNKLTESLV